MNNKTLVKLSNIIGIISIILLIYWVFIFISITVFELKIFRENITETFYFSVLGILALMFGALMINIMFNLTRIANKHNNDDIKGVRQTSKTLLWLFIFSFPVLFSFLYIGDHLTAKKKEKMLIASAKSILENDLQKKDQLMDYTFDWEWIQETGEILRLYSKIDTHFPHVSVIVSDTIGHTDVYLDFGAYAHSYNIHDTIPPIKTNYIRNTTKVEREYLEKIFSGSEEQIRFSAHKGRYELFYPYIRNNKRIVLYFSDYQRYGKMGS